MAERDTSRQALGKVWRRARTSRDDLMTAAESMRQLTDAMAATGAPAEVRAGMMTSVVTLETMAGAIELLMAGLPATDTTPEGNA